MSKVIPESMTIEIVKASNLPLTEKESSYLYDECLSGNVTWGDADKTLISFGTLRDYLYQGNDEKITKRIEKKLAHIDDSAFIDLEN